MGVGDSQPAHTAEVRVQRPEAVPSGLELFARLHTAAAGHAKYKAWARPQQVALYSDDIIMVSIHRAKSEADFDTDFQEDVGEVYVPWEEIQTELSQGEEATFRLGISSSSTPLGNHAASLDYRNAFREALKLAKDDKRAVCKVVIGIRCLSANGAAVKDGNKAAPVVVEKVGTEGATEKGQLQLLLRNRSLVVLVAAVGIFEGINITWTSLLQTMLGPLSISEKTVGWMGFANGLATNIAGILAGSVVDTFFHRRLKAGILVGASGSSAWLLVFMLSLPCCGVSSPSSILPHNNWSLTAALIGAGAFRGIFEPLAYELSAELMYPAKESTSAGFIVFVLNVVAGLMLGANTFLDAAVMNYIINAVVLLVVVSILFGVREVYKRPQNTTSGIDSSL